MAQSGQTKTYEGSFFPLSLTCTLTCASSPEIDDMRPDHARLRHPDCDACPVMARADGMIQRYRNGADALVLAALVVEGAPAARVRPPGGEWHAVFMRNMPVESPLKKGREQA